ncbi:hypothetical protein N1851_031154 [Merluccius polli]|uniref:Uncharacterized protein n=1 Tax=Merluccius polli TaxID=89951 RepID=A0AA47M4E6_MERPO|nr:hypothetical protein N1851_031154 [Merluccius polli]
MLLMYAPSRSLRSSGIGLLVVPQVRTETYREASSTSLPPTPHILSKPEISLSPTLASSVLSSLPSPEQFSLLSTEEASSTLLSSLSSSLDSLCPLFSRLARSSPPPPWLSESLQACRTELRAAERKWKRSDCSLPCSLQCFLLSSPRPPPIPFLPHS